MPAKNEEEVQRARKDPRNLHLLELVPGSRVDDEYHEKRSDHHAADQLDPVEDTELVRNEHEDVEAEFDGEGPVDAVDVADTEPAVNHQMGEELARRDVAGSLKAMMMALVITTPAQ